MFVSSVWVPSRLSGVFHGSLDVCGFVVPGALISGFTDLVIATDVGTILLGG